MEQESLNPSEYYKVYNNEQLKLAESSKFGIEIGPITVSSIGQADDVALIADNPTSLQGLLDLSSYFCKKKHVKLSPGKTKLQDQCFTRFPNIYFLPLDFRMVLGLCKFVNYLLCMDFPHPYHCFALHCPSPNSSPL